MDKSDVSKNSLNWKQQVFIYFLVVFAVATSARVIAGSWQSRFPMVNPDSFVFARIASEGLLSSEFWFGEKPLLTPLVLFLVGGGVREFVLFQTVLYFASAAILCFASVKVFRSRIAQVFSVVSISAVILQSRYAWWSTLVLSESLSLSTAALSIAAWLWFSHFQTNRSKVLAFSSTVIWMLVRDSNTTATLATLIFFLIATKTIRRPKTDLNKQSLRIGVALILAAGAFSIIGQSIAERYEYPVMNNIGQRVLTKPELLSWFESQGMPVSPALIEMTGLSAFDDGGRMLNDPELEEFRKWIRESGWTTLFISYLRFGPLWLNESVKDFENNLDQKLLGYDIFNVSHRLPDGSFLGLGGPTNMVTFLTWALAVLASLIATWFHNYSLRAVIFSLFLISSIADYFASWLGDSIEIARHLVGWNFRTALIFSVISAGGLDSLFAKRRDTTIR